MNDADIEAYKLWLVSNGYTDIRLLPRGRYAAVAKFAFTHAIITGHLFDFINLENRWCYRSHDKALQALEHWDGDGEPTGWHRHPASGRRVAETDGEIGDDGLLVELGASYRRL